MNTQDRESLPEGVVAMWDQTASTIPYGWDAVTVHREQQILEVNLFEEELVKRLVLQEGARLTLIHTLSPVSQPCIKYGRCIPINTKCMYMEDLQWVKKPCLD